MEEFCHAFGLVLTQSPIVDLRIQAEGIFYQDECVLRANNDDHRMIEVLYQDGIRRLVFHRGVALWELEVLISATSTRLFEGEDEDTITYLWQHQLKHIQYVVVETQIVSSVPSEASANSGSKVSIERAIDGVLQEIYGGSEADPGTPSIALDSSDLSAWDIAQRLSPVDEMAPGFHPQHQYPLAPSYGSNLLHELEQENDISMGLRATHTIFEALHSSDLAPRSRRVLYDALLTIYDTSLTDFDQLSLAAHIIQESHLCPDTAERAQWFLEALAETRLRQATQHLTIHPAPELIPLITYYRSCGTAAADVAISALSMLNKPQDHRILSDLILELGGGSLSRIEQLLNGGNIFLIREILYLLTYHPNVEARQILERIEYHPSAEVRIALLENSRLVGDINTGVELGIRLFEAPEPSVRIAAVQHLARRPCRRVIYLFEKCLQAPEFDSLASALKLAVLTSYIYVSPSRAIPALDALIHRGCRLFITKQIEDSAIQAIRSLHASKHTAQVNTLLTRATHTRNRRIKAAAVAVLDGSWSPA
ncbi:MAG: hypothetical protein KTR25_06025 [Myxococcales bacterium]|nr:hypothetical protein [Myxococcales bacterium]